MSFLDIFKNKQNKKIESAAKNEQFSDTFILALVHKLRNSLSGARWALDIISNSEKKEENKEILNKGYNQIIEAINTVNEILKISEINSKDGPFNLKMEKINFCVVVDNIIKSLDFLIKKNEITLEYENKSNPIIILGDKEVLNIGLTNLFDNAFRYSPKGKVIVDVSKEGNMAKLVIKDNGIGIDKEDFRHLFEKFYRGKNAKLIDPNENGIGLFATKKIIEIHKGNISINSEINKGTIIEVLLPID